MLIVHRQIPTKSSVVPREVKDIMTQYLSIRRIRSYLLRTCVILLRGITVSEIYILILSQSPTKMINAKRMPIIILFDCTA